MRARSALFDLFGSHLRARGGATTVAALVRLMEPLGFAAPAVRTAVSRTVRHGWLHPVRLPDGPGYALTTRAELRMDETLARVYRTRTDSWDQQWHVVLLGPVRARTVRERVGSSLLLLGYAELEPGTWLAPRPARELPALLAADGLRARCFRGPHDGDDADLAATAWRLDALAEQYREFVRRWSTPLSGALAVDPVDDAEAFAASQRLLHDWRGFLFRDPGLPAELLPAEWAGAHAAAFFDRETARLAPATTRFVDGCLTNPD